MASGKRESDLSHLPRLQDLVGGYFPVSAEFARHLIEGFRQLTQLRRATGRARLD